VFVVGSVERLRPLADNDVDVQGREVNLHGVEDWKLLSEDVEAVRGWNIEYGGICRQQFLEASPIIEVFRGNIDAVDSLSYTCVGKLGGKMVTLSNFLARGIDVKILDVGELSSKTIDEGIQQVTIDTEGLATCEADGLYGFQELDGHDGNFLNVV